MEELLTRKEPLRKQLRQYLETDGALGCMIRHPLIFSVPHHEGFNALVNAGYEQKLEQVRAAWANGDWSSYVWLHERPYRLRALFDLQDIPTDDWWNLVGKVWMDSENIRQNQDEWDEILRLGQGETHAMMTDDERAELEAMDDEFVIFQGHTAERDDGWSWTTSRQKALWFARRFAKLERRLPW